MRIIFKIKNNLNKQIFNLNNLNIMKNSNNSKKIKIAVIIIIIKQIIL